MTHACICSIFVIQERKSIHHPQRDVINHMPPIIAARQVLDFKPGNWGLHRGLLVFPINSIGFCPQEISTPRPQCKPYGCGPLTAPRRGVWVTRHFTLRSFCCGPLLWCRFNLILVVCVGFLRCRGIRLRWLRKGSWIPSDRFHCMILCPSHG